jgi:hypothetical protein
MPFRDPQFWIVTILALAGLWILLRPFIPRSRRTAGSSASASCPNCASGSAAAKPRRVALTIDKKRI